MYKYITGMDLDMRISVQSEQSNIRVKYTRMIGTTDFVSPPCYLCCQQSLSITIHAKVAVDRANRQPYQLGRQPITIVPFTGIAYVERRNPRSTVTLHRIGSVDHTESHINEPAHEILVLIT